MDEVRDIAVAASFAALTALTLLVLAAVTVGGVVALRVVRRMRRLHDHRLLPAMEWANARLNASAERGPLSAAETARLILRLLRILRGGKPKRKRHRNPFLRLLAPPG